MIKPIDVDMTPPIVKKLIAEKASARRKEDTAKFIQSCEDLGDWFRNHFHHKETIGEYMELVDLRKVKIFLFTILLKNNNYFIKSNLSPDSTFCKILELGLETHFVAKKDPNDENS